jgi:hypothetical protein
MTDLDHLEEIVESTAFGFHGPTPTHLSRQKHPTEYCGGGHLWTDATTRYYRYRGRRRRLCRLCDKERRHKPMQCSSISPSIAPGIAQAGAEQ